MEITIRYSAKERIEKFLDYLKKRATDKVHKENGDIIADFLDKVIVVELKRLENDQEFIDEKIEIPNELLTEPLKKMKGAFDKVFKDFVDGKSIDIDTPPPPSEAFPILGTIVKDVRKRNGNGHARNKKRNLLKDEKDTIRNKFLALNGQITEDACLPIHQALGNETTIFQITGFVTYLHHRVASGKLQVENMDAYETFLQEHRALWAKYNSPKYISMRR